MVSPVTARAKDHPRRASTRRPATDQEKRAQKTRPTTAASLRVRALPLSAALDRRPARAAGSQRTAMSASSALLPGRARAQRLGDRRRGTKARSSPRYNPLPRSPPSLFLPASCSSPSSHPLPPPKHYTGAQRSEEQGGQGLGCPEQQQGQEEGALGSVLPLRVLPPPLSASPPPTRPPPAAAMRGGMEGSTAPPPAPPPTHPRLPARQPVRLAHAASLPPQTKNPSPPPLPPRPPLPPLHHRRSGARASSRRRSTTWSCSTSRRTTS
jgi:hypothetical protein